VDIDSHESSPANLWVERFGSIAREFADANLQSRGVTSAVKEKDDAEINVDNVWKLKLEKAPGAFDMDRRLEVLNFTGIKTQVMYPGNFALMAQALYNNADDPSVFKALQISDRREYAVKLVQSYNDWCVRVARKTDRIRAVAFLVGETPEALLACAKSLIAQGVRGFWIAVDRPPGGVSPASPALDPLWALLADAHCPLLVHIQITRDFLKTMVWGDAPAFKGWRNDVEFAMNPYSLSTVHLPLQNYLTAMVLGGVFDRHPKLRFGCAEFTAHWVGSWAENMDMWYANQPFSDEQPNRMLKEKPSEYVRRNIRVAAFPFEGVGRYIQRFGFEDVYCYASDFPHHEGGRDPMGKFTNSLEVLGPAVLRKFFVDNGAHLMAD
jgi:predicted TIM-barrel fold metal-dependent hydrolase